MHVLAPLVDRRSPKVSTHACVGTSGDRRSPKVPTHACVGTSGDRLPPRAKGSRKQHRYATTGLGFVLAKRHDWVASPSAIALALAPTQQCVGLFCCFTLELCVCVCVCVCVWLLIIGSMDVCCRGWGNTIQTWAFTHKLAIPLTILAQDHFYSVFLILHVQSKAADNL